MLFRSAVSPPLTIEPAELTLLADAIRSGLDSLSTEPPVPAAPGA